MRRSALAFPKHDALPPYSGFLASLRLLRFRFFFSNHWLNCTANALDRAFPFSLLLLPLQFEVPKETTPPDGSQIYNGLAPGSLYAYGFATDNVVWTSEGGNFTLDSDAGDTILTYCIDADGDPHFIQGFSFAAGGWAEPGLPAEQYGASRSSLPDALKDQGAVEVPFLKNYIYNGTTAANLETLLVEYADPSNYVGSNETRWDIAALGEPDDKPSGAAASMFGGAVAAMSTAILAVAASSSAAWML